jgi:flagellar motor switch protein FliG
MSSKKEMTVTNAEKAVLFLLSLDEEIARPIVHELSEADIRKLRTVASTMREVQKDSVDKTFREFMELSDNAIAVPRGGLRYLRRLSVDALGEDRARAVFEDGVTSPLARLESASPEDVAALLANEPPQLAAAVLSMMSPRSAAAILAELDDGRQASIVKSVSRMTQLPASVIDDVAAALAASLPSSDASTLVTVDGVAKAAELLNASGKATATTILTTLEAEDAGLATTVRQAMFVFDDLVRLDARAMRTLLSEVQTDRLTIALKGTTAEVLAAVLRGLSQRAGDLIKDDLENLRNVRKADVEAARREVVDVALRLEGEGKIILFSEEE